MGSLCLYTPNIKESLTTSTAEVNNYYTLIILLNRPKKSYVYVYMDIQIYIEN